MQRIFKLGNVTTKKLPSWDSSDYFLEQLFTLILSFSFSIFLFLFKDTFLISTK